MQNKLKLNRFLQNRIILTTQLKLETINKDRYNLSVVYLKRDYSDNIEKKINSEGFLIKNLSRKQDEKISKQVKYVSEDFILKKETNLKKAYKNFNWNLKIQEKEWKEIWKNKFNKYKKIGKYLPTISDRLFFSYLQERKLNLQSKYTFNNFISSSKIINYSFQQTNRKVDLNSVYKLLKSFFKTLKSLISFPILKNTPEKLKIILFYYVIPPKSILLAKKNYNYYIRKDAKLFKDTILRTKLIKIMARFKMIMFISKWKENNIIKLPNFNKKTNSLSIPLVYKVQMGLIENNNLTNPDIEILKNLGLSINNIIEKEQEKIGIFSIKTIQYNLSKLIPFYKNLVTLLFEKDLKLLLENNNNKHLKNLKFLNSNYCIEINKILASNLLNKLSVNKDLKIENLTGKFEKLNIGMSIEKENKLIKVSTTENKLKQSLVVNISKLQLENGHFLNTVQNTNILKLAQELIVIYSELNFLKEKIKHQEIFKYNYKKNIVYSLNFLNKLILFFIKLKNYNNVLAAKQKQFSDSISEKLDYFNFEIEGLEQLNLDNLEKFYNSYSNFKFDSKFIYSLQEKKDIFNYLNVPSIKEVLTLIKEQKFEFSEEPLIMNYSNPYGYKNANLLLITALHSLYRAILIKHLNKTKKEKRGSVKYFLKKMPINEQDNFNVNDLNFNDYLKIIKERLVYLNYNRADYDSRKNLNLLNNIESNNGSSLISLNKIKFKYLISFLEKIFNKSIELELIRLKYPAHNSDILAQVLAFSSNRLKFFRIMRRLLYTVNIKHPGGLKPNFNIIPSFLSGIKIRLGGRLSTENLIPRKTVKTYQIGSIARNKTNISNHARITLKNKRGAYSFTVITSHIFYTNKK